MFSFSDKLHLSVERRNKDVEKCIHLSWMRGFLINVLIK